ncbi:mannonate dehydratase [Adhaeribacter radiodurans]|uniref:Mannonate dehydratase n=1 Tax=Adhaeribacter radiodurans TaxID=2745197 RepID=A0A7L7LAS4_9BACT|nr:mannonate dehydratase [Adhaeribacter radiodurans]QMU29519.1 mannonate dehydratase [Adhaeribacter radiodurans]
MKMRQTWRWFGPADPVTLQDIRQTGAEGIVTALHHVPHGAVWPVEEIKKRQQEIEAFGLSWDVVESVTVHESIKTRSGDYQHYIDLYKESIRNIAACGIKIVTYNFMPVNDWTRTDLNLVMPDGSKALYFNWFDLAIFDIHLLQRPNAEQDYPEYVVREAEKRFQEYTKEKLEQLVYIIMFGIPGEQKQTLEQMQDNLARYKDIDRNVLRENLKYFLQEISPVAEEVGIKLAIHPDDPPYPILGLPRVVSTLDDLNYILESVPSPSNGICFCTGSLGANLKNNLPDMAKQIGKRIHFVHLRNVTKDEHGNFFEADHLGGDVDMYAVVKEILTIQQQVANPIPFRPDHGHQMLDDLAKVTNPGYSAIGRLRGLAEIRGLELGICRAQGWE